jgi:endonuclease/exonuclease/phosphatase family metal-dependent hydrolase
MRVVSWNLHGAGPGHASNEKQQRSWAHIRDLGADLILAQEVRPDGIPPWVTGEWTLLSGVYGHFRKDWPWGSVIAARPGLHLSRFPEEQLSHWLQEMYDLVLVGQFDLPGAGPAFVASVHAAAVSVEKWIEGYVKSPPLPKEELAALQRPGYRGRPYVNDLAFTALDHLVKGQRFIVTGDWNTCRQFSGGKQFFARAEKRKWVECHRPPEEQSYFRKGCRPLQLDHVFCDPETARAIRSCHILVDDTVRELSDHAPLVADFVAAG